MPNKKFQGCYVPIPVKSWIFLNNFNVFFDINPTIHWTFSLYGNPLFHPIHQNKYFFSELRSIYIYWKKLGSFALNAIHILTMHFNKRTLNKSCNERIYYVTFYRRPSNPWLYYYEIMIDYDIGIITVSPQLHNWRIPKHIL